MLKSCGAKYIGRALCLWNAENDFLNNVKRAREAVPQALAADSEMILEACVFETVTPRVNEIEIPDWVFTALGQPVEKRNFRYDEMIYPAGQRRPMGRNAQVPDESRLETQLRVRLLNRTTRSVAPTEAGERLIERLGPALTEETIPLGLPPNMTRRRVEMLACENP